MSKNKTKTNKSVGYAVLSFIFILMIGLFFLIPGMVEKAKSNQEEKILKNLEEIYTSATIIDNIEGGLHNDSDNAGKYKKLSKMSGFKVYNSPKKQDYYLLKDYNDGKVVVWYGEKLRYPSESPKESIAKNDSSRLSTEDLFTYDESQGIVMVTGFSQAGTESLNSGSVIQIPSSYKGREVTAIADKAFYGKNIMGVVIIPKSISKIGSSAFTNNGEKGNSDDIKKPYAGSWQVKKGKWIKIN